MKTHDELILVLDSGWETLRSARRLLAPEFRESFNLQKVGTAGIELDQLACNLRSLGYDKPARMAYSAAYVLNGLISETIPVDQELLNKTSNIVTVLAEMLVELEATSEITLEEPVAVIEQLKLEWNSESVAGNPQPRLPDPHFRLLSEVVSAGQEVADGLPAISEQLVVASESLLERVRTMNDFPYSPALSQIHHLAMTIRNRVGGSTKIVTRSDDEVVVPLTSNQSEPMEIKLIAGEISPKDLLKMDGMTESRIELPKERSTILIEKLQAPESDKIPNVLAIDDSPFFRMLLTSAVESSGYSISAVPKLEDAISICGQTTWEAIIWSGTEKSGTVEVFRKWLFDSGTENAKIIILTISGNETDLKIPNSHQLRRTDISGLMSLMTKLLGDTPQKPRMIA